MILVNSSVLFDIVTDDPQWFDWSRRQLEAAELAGALAINAIVYAEFSVRYPSLEQTEQAVDDLGLVILDIPRPALFLAGKAFQAYRAAKGANKASVLPDFLIGAHAAVLEIPLLTRDPRRVRTHFPTVELITP